MNTEKNATILVVDDDENQRWMVKTYLQKHDLLVHTAENGEQMRQRLAEQKVDLILLDVSMPGENGFTLARYLRENHDVGIIMLTAATDLFDRVLGLEIGADDYITKPFEPRELLARVKALLRRSTEQSDQIHNKQTVKKGQTLTLGDFRLCLDAHELRDSDNKLVSLTSMEFDLLKAFAENPGRVLTRDNLLAIAHKRDWDPFDRSVDIRIARVRRKIEADPAKPEVIKTVRGVGYIFVG
ncbi:MAG: response regulator [Granulosicoccus sp.]